MPEFKSFFQDPDIDPDGVLSVSPEFRSGILKNAAEFLRASRTK